MIQNDLQTFDLCHSAKLIRKIGRGGGDFTNCNIHFSAGVEI